jgi:hypothetical protein
MGTRVIRVTIDVVFKSMLVMRIIRVISESLFTAKM